MSAYQKLKEVKVEISDLVRYYSQYSQESSIEFTLCTKKEDGSYHEQIPPVTCREIFTDAVLHGNLGIKSPEMYGHYTDEPMDVSSYILSITMDINVMESFIYNIRIMSRFFAKQGLDRTKIYKTETPYRLILVFDKWWLSSPVLVSLHSLLFRACSYDVTASTFPALLKKLIYDGNYDDMYLSKLLSLLDITQLVYIFKEVLKDQPLTGVNDLVAIEKFQRKDSVESLTEYSTLFLQRPQDDRDIEYSLAIAHSYSGIYCFLCAAEDIEYYRTYQSDIRYTWINNLYKLLTSGYFVNKTIKI